MKLKVVIWGTGNTASILTRYLNYDVVEVFAYIDNNMKMGERKQYTESIPSILPEELDKVINIIDYILIASNSYKDIYRQLIGMSIPSNKIKQVCDINLYKDDEVVRKITTYNFCRNNHEYKIGKYIIDLGEKHNLPMYQREFSLYDKFLFQLAGLLKGSDNWIIDIGANVGDTVAGLRSNSDCSILAVEPVDEYFELLVKNIDHVDEKENIRPVKYFITYNETKKYTSNKYDGSANMRDISGTSDDAEASSISLENLIKENDIDWKKILLLKVDTDGFDYECILSCGEQLRNINAYIFFENYIIDKDNMNAYNDMYNYLKDMDYEVFYIFDNYGNYLLKGDKNLLISINEYLIRGREKISKVTFEYTDVLACKEK